MNIRFQLAVRRISTQDILHAWGEGIVHWIQPVYGIKQGRVILTSQAKWFAGAHYIILPKQNGYAAAAAFGLQTFREERSCPIWLSLTAMATLSWLLERKYILLDNPALSHVLHDSSQSQSPAMTVSTEMYPPTNTPLHHLLNTIYRMVYHWLAGKGWVTLQWKWKRLVSPPLWAAGLSASFEIKGLEKAST